MMSAIYGWLTRDLMSLKLFIARVLIVENKTNVELYARLILLIKLLDVDHEQCCL